MTYKLPDPEEDTDAYAVAIACRWLKDGKLLEGCTSLIRSAMDHGWRDGAEQSPGTVVHVKILNLEAAISDALFALEQAGIKDHNSVTEGIHLLISQREHHRRICNEFKGILKSFGIDGTPGALQVALETIPKDVVPDKWAVGTRIMLRINDRTTGSEPGEVGRIIRHEYSLLFIKIEGSGVEIDIPRSSAEEDLFVIPPDPTRTPAESAADENWEHNHR